MLSIWNASSLFVILTSARPRRTCKREYLDGLLARIGFMGVVETRGTINDLDHLLEMHRYYGRGRGMRPLEVAGLVLQTLAGLLHGRLEVRTEVHWAGRAMTLSIQVGQRVHFTLLYFDLVALMPACRRLFTKMVAFHSEPAGPKFVSGDMNLVHLGDSRLTGAGEERADCDHLATT